MQVPSLIPMGLGAPSLCHLLYTGYHPQNGGECPKVSQSYFQGKESKYNLIFMHLGASIEVTKRPECIHAIQHL